MKTLSKKQIDSLFEFTKKHYVDYYDVQVELVDHLANDIELIMQKQPEMSFDQARDIAFKKFGITGFYDIISAQMSAMQKEYYLLILKYLKDILLSGKSLILMVLLLLTNMILHQIEYNAPIYFASMTVFASIVFAFVFKKNREINKRINNKEKVLMSEAISASLGNATIFISAIYNLLSMLFFRQSNESISKLLANYSIFFSLLLIILFVYIYISIQNASNEIRNKYRKKYLSPIR